MVPSKITVLLAVASAVGFLSSAGSTQPHPLIWQEISLKTARSIPAALQRAQLGHLARVWTAGLSSKTQHHQARLLLETAIAKQPTNIHDSGNSLRKRRPRGR